MTILRSACTLILAWAAGCASPVRPAPLVPMTVGPLLFPVEGVIVHGGTGEPVVQAMVDLAAVAPRGDSARRVRASGTGGFRFQSVTPGRYTLTTRALGFRVRVDSIIVADQSPPRLSIPMKEVAYCLGSCPPDPEIVAAARARRGEWSCELNHEVQADRRAFWLGALTSDSRVHQILGRQPDSAEVRRHLSRVSNRGSCARAVGFFDDQRVLSELTAVVFRFRSLYLLAPGGNTGHYFFIVDGRFRLLADLSPLQE